MERELQNGHATLNGYEIDNGSARLSASAAANGLSKANERGAVDDAAATNGHAAVNGSAIRDSAIRGNGEAEGRSSSNGKPRVVAAANGSPQQRAAAPAARPLQQVGQARRRQGLSVRCVAQRLNMSVGEVRAQEDDQADMLLSELYRWQSVLEVPLEELLAEPEDTLSSRVLTRARMLRVMKTARALRAQARSESEHRLAKLLVSQLIEIMPELKEVAAWPTVGHRRTADEMGRIAERPIPDDFMHEAS